MTLVVLHGLGRFAAEWEPCAHALDPAATLVDLPELRVTERAPQLHVVRAGLRAAVGVARCDLIGHSGGAFVVLELAAESPELVDHLILVSAAPPAASLARVHAPILVVLGEYDGLHVEARPGLDVVTIPGAGHDPHLDRPEAFLAAVRAALAR